MRYELPNDVILTDGQGRPFSKPEPPGPEASIEEKISWLRADSAYRDAVAACTYQAFDSAFRKALKRP